ncbi:class I SAM-dependent methyltransferase [Agrobacterium rosae]|uniref:class I SAM-dependent methyltransferase n=1 Tax=Agrobacterium rosae TaxID=1972867 RepID=UPI000CD7FE54|nr:class I SAM-dependent methyltransferase [Agrobacterium rosae]POO52109.1 SAM-dependent methyltransferase [Agrobacterium rosae]
MFNLKRIFQRKIKNRPAPEEDIFDQYCFEVPSNQTAIDSVPGWTSALPPEAEVLSGRHPLFADGRIVWAIEKMGSIEGRRVLEIGPLEAMHTYMLNLHRPALIDAVEANKLSFLRCLVSKEILNIDRARFHLGDAMKWLEGKNHHYDLIVASGVLYHLVDPAEFLSRMGNSCNNIFIWTHYYDENAFEEEDVRKLPFSGKVELREVAGTQVRYYERRYFNANSNVDFCGGMRDRHYWMHREDILSVLNKLGFDDVEIHSEDPQHSGGPAFSLFAKRSNTA